MNVRRELTSPFSRTQPPLRVLRAYALDNHDGILARRPIPATAGASYSGTYDDPAGGSSRAARPVSRQRSRSWEPPTVTTV